MSLENLTFPKDINQNDGVEIFLLLWWSSTLLNLTRVFSNIKIKFFKRDKNKKPSKNGAQMLSSVQNPELSTYRQGGERMR